MQAVVDATGPLTPEQRHTLAVLLAPQPRPHTVASPFGTPGLTGRRQPCRPGRAPSASDAPTDQFSINCRRARGYSAAERTLPARSQRDGHRSCYGTDEVYVRNRRFGALMTRPLGRRSACAPAPPGPAGAAPPCAPCPTPPALVASVRGEPLPRSEPPPRAERHRTMQE